MEFDADAELIHKKIDARQNAFLFAARSSELFDILMRYQLWPDAAADENSPGAGVDAGDKIDQGTGGGLEPPTYPFPHLSLSLSLHL